MKREHLYSLEIEWTGNTGTGTTDYRSYERTHIISVNNKPAIQASSDPSFRGDATRYNPEELFVASLSSCHMLWFLHLCAENGIVVLQYSDKPTGIMLESENGEGKFKEVTLNPLVYVQDERSLHQLDEMHQKANKLCFIANSLNFEVKHMPIGKVYEYNPHNRK